MNTESVDRISVGMIDSYDFGRIVVDGKKYTSDLIIFSDRVKDGWWRKKGHRLHRDDIEEVVEKAPEVLIIGTGYSGAMRVPDETKRYIEDKGIELVIQTTKEACKTYNKILQSGKEAVAAFHLTC